MKLGVLGVAALLSLCGCTVNVGGGTAPTVTVTSAPSSSAEPQTLKLTSDGALPPPDAPLIYATNTPPSCPGGKLAVWPSNLHAPGSRISNYPTAPRCIDDMATQAGITSEWWAALSTTQKAKICGEYLSPGRYGDSGPAVVAMDYLPYRVWTDNPESMATFNAAMKRNCA